MQLRSKGRYAVSALIDLYTHQHDGPVTLAAISERQLISLSYLEQLFRRLRIHGLVKSIRGPGGGYLLNRPASCILIADIIRAVDESIQASRYRGGARSGPESAVQQLWASLDAHIFRFLDVITLQDVCEKRTGLGDVTLAPLENYIADGAILPDESNERIAAVS
jgi:Rrf2 family iron-sulfur cluster assembly transcriptional regulator